MSAAAATVAQATVTDKETLNDDARMPEANGAQGMPREKAKKGTLKRLLKYVFAYRARMIFIIIAIIVSAVAQAGSALFLQALIDRYIMPLVGNAYPTGRRSSRRSSSWASSTHSARSARGCTRTCSWASNRAS